MPSDWTGPEKDLSLYIEPIRGYRFFRINFDPKGLFLSPISISNQRSIFDENFILEPATCYYMGDNPDYCNQCQEPIDTVYPYSSYPICAHLNKLVKQVKINNTYEIITLDIDAPLPENSIPFDVGYIHNTTVPNSSCSCGYWATYDPFFTKSAVHTSREVVMTEVEVRGRFVLCEKGFRAAQIKITGIVNDPKVYRHDAIASLTNPPKFIEDDFDKRVRKRTGLPPQGYFNRINVKRLMTLLPGVPFIDDINTHLMEHPIINPEDFA